MQKLYPDKKYFTISETAELLGVSIDTLRRLETRGMLKIKREDGRRIYTQRDLLVLKKLYAGAEDPNNILLPVHEAANWLGVSVDTLRRWEKAGKLEAVRTAGGHRRYRLSAIQDAQAGLKPSPAGVHPATRNVLVKHIHHYMSSPSQRLYEPAAELYKTLHIDQKRVLKLGLATLAILLLLLGLKRASIIGYRQSAISHQPSAIDSRVLQAESVNEDVIFAVNIPTNLRGLATFEQGLTVAGTASFEDVDIANDLTLAGDLAVNGGDITTTATTASIFNTNATTLDIGEAATAISIGATTGTTTINNDLILSGNLDVNGTGTNDIAGTLNLSGNNLSSPGDLVLNLAGGSLIFTNAQTINIGGSSSHVAYNVIGDSTSGASSSMTSDDDLYVEGNLEVDGSITGSISSTIINPGFTTGSVVFQGASGLAQDNTNFFWDDTNNRLGVGTNSPSGVLHVVGECVAAGTKIRRRRRRGKNGEWEEEDIPVEDIQPGDEVLSLNDQTGRFEWHKVEKTMNKGTQDTYALTTSSGKRILTTRQHPYLVIDKPLITQGTFEVDQSIRIEELAKATIVGIALGNLMFASKIPQQTKKAILRRYQKPNRRNLFAVHTFAHAVALTFKAASIYPARVIIDTEYPGFNRPIREIIQLYFPETTVLFDEIGKHSPAHLAAYGVFIGKRKEDVVLEGVSETKKDRGHKALRIVTDQDRRLTIRNPHGLNSKKSYYTPRDLSRGKWTKISQIRKGQYIATIDGWEKVAGIQRIKRLKTYDLQIEGTHNFIGNNIVAHNTFLGGSITLGAVSGDTLTFNASTLATPNNLNIDSNTLFIDAANNRVGIGTVTPSTTLHTLATNAVHRIETNVQGTGTAELRLTGVNAGNARFISFYETASGDLELYRLGTDNPNGSNALVLRDQSVNVITIQDNGAADTLYLRSSGNGGTVGINTSTPNEKLEIAGGLRVGQAPTTFTTVTDNPLTSGATIVNVVSTSGYPPAGTLLIDSEAMTYIGKGGGQFTGVTRGALGTTAAQHNLGATVKNYLFTALATATTPKMTITGDGNVGIGTTSPTSLLVVSNGELRVDNSQIRLAGANHYLLQNSGVNFRIQNGSNSSVPFTIESSDVSNTLYLNSVGNVGIGTVSPAGHLDISGNLSSTSWTTSGIAYQVDAATFTDTSGTGTIASRVANSFGIPTFASSNAVTVTDAATLYISGAPAAGANTIITNAYALWVDDGNVRIDGTLNAQGSIDTTFTAGSVVFAGTNGVLAEDNPNFFWDDTSNELGIGTNNPTQKLHSLLTTTTTNFVNYDAAINGAVTLTSTADDATAKSIHAVQARPTVNIANNFVNGAVAGLRSEAVKQGTGTLGQLHGATLGLFNQAGTITTAIGLAISLSPTAGTTTTTYTGINLNASTSNTIGTQYGLYVSDFTSATSANYAIVTNAGNIVFNEGGDASTDFRVEGDNDANLLFVDASADSVGIGTNAPDSQLHISKSYTTALSSSQAQQINASNVFSTTAQTGNYFASYSSTGTLNVGVDGYVGFRAASVTINTSSTATQIAGFRTRSGNPGNVFTLCNATTCTVTSLYGVLLNQPEGANTGNTLNITNDYGYYLEKANSFNYGGTVNITNRYGMRLGGIGAAGVNVTSNYGIYLEDQTGALTNNYAILTNAGNIVFNEGGDASTDFRVEGDNDANLLFVDADVDRVGIGTAIPSALNKLHVSGGNFRVDTVIAGRSFQMKSNSGSELTIIAPTTDPAFLQFENTSDIYAIGVDTNDGALKFKQGWYGTGTEKMRLSAGGNVGIGTTAPDARLEINHATGDNLRLTYDDSNGSAVNFTDFSLGTTGDLTITGSTASIASAASAEKTFLTLTPATITLTSTTAVTDQMDQYLVNRATIAGDTATVTVDDASTLTIAGPPAEGTNVALTDAYALKINSASTTSTNAYGLYVVAPTGAGSNYSAAFGDDTDMVRFASTGDLTFVDANDGASITGPAGGALTVTASLTNLNLQNDGTIDVNIAGGSGATGCTVANSTGNLTCTGNITGASSGTAGYWSRSSTTLSPATANDIVSIPSTDNAYTTSSLLTTSLTQSAATGTSVSGDIANFSFSPTYSTAVTTPSITGNVLDIARTSVTNASFASTLTVSGAVSTIQNSATQTTGTLNVSADVLRIAENYASANATGTALNITTAATGTGALALRVNDDGTFTDTTPFVIEADGDVGIGTTVPSSHLHVYATAADAVVNIESSDLSDPYIQFRTNNTNRFRLQNADNDLVFFAAATTEVARFSSNPGIIFNDTGSATIDLRVEGDNDANLLFTDASADTVFMGASTATGASNKLVIAHTASTTLNSDALNITLTDTTGDAFVSKGINAISDFTGSTAQSNAVIGINAVARNSGSGNITNEAQALQLDIQLTSTGSITSAKGLQIDSFSDTGAGSITTAYGIYINDQTAAATNYAILTNAGNIVFNEGGDASSDFRVEGDNDANLLFVDASLDRVGIGNGDLSGGAKLDIAISNSSTAQTAASSLSMFLRNTDTTNNNWQNIAFQDAPGSFWTAAIGVKHIDHTNDYGELHFATRGSLSTLATRMMIDQNGNVGIGTTAPDARLEINHATGDNLRLTYDDSNGSAVNFTDFSLGTTGDLTITGSAASIASAAGAEKTFLTLTPATITLTGVVQVTSQMDQYLVNRATIAGDTATVTVDDASTFTIAGPPSEGTNVNLAEAYALKVNTAATTATTAYGLYVDAPTGATNNYAAIFNGGNVGIGTASPADELTIQGDETETSTTYEGLQSFSVSNGSMAEIYRDYNGTYNYLGIDSYNVGNTVKTPIVLHEFGGDVGIGTATPDVNLHISGASEAPSTGVEGLFGLKDSSNNKYLNMGFVSSGSTRVWIQSFSLLPLVINEGGNNVGIGTTGPDAALDVRTASDEKLRLTETDGTTYASFSVLDSGALTIAPTGSLVNITGDLDVSDQGAFGSAGVITAGQVLRVDNSFTDTSGSLYGAVILAQADPGSASTGNYYGLSTSARLDTTNGANQLNGLDAVANVAAAGTVSVMTGSLAQAYVSNGVAATVSTLQGINVYNPDAEDATVTTAIGINLDSPSVDTGSITNAYGIDINAGTIGAGSIANLYPLNIDADSRTVTTNKYGLRMGTMSGAANNYQLYIEGTANNYFAGNVGIGESVPVAKVEIAQTDAANDEVLYLDTEESTEGQTVWALESDTINNGQSADTVKAHFEADGSLFLSFTGTQTSFALCHTTNGQTNNDEVVDCTGTPGGDYMEFYPTSSLSGLRGTGPTDSLPMTGEIVATSNQYTTTRDGERIVKLVKSTSEYQNNVIGIVSDPAKAGDFNSVGYNLYPEDNPMPIALNGRVPVKIAQSSMPIAPGDFLTASNDPGSAMKATRAGQIIGKALAAWEPCANEQCKDTVLVFVQNSYFDPDMLSLNDTGSLEIAESQALQGDSLLQGVSLYDSLYEVIKTTEEGAKKVIERVGAFSQLVAANIKAGIVESRLLIADSIQAAAATIDNLTINNRLLSPVVETNLISPLADETDVNIQIGKRQEINGESEIIDGKLAIQNPDGEEVASIDSRGNLAVSNEATISGTLYASKIYTDEIVAKNGAISVTYEELLAQITTVEAEQSALADQIANSTIGDTTDDLESSQFGTLIANTLFVTGTTAVDSLSATKSIAVGTDLMIQSPQPTTDNLQTTNSIDTLSSPLSIQSLGLQPLYIMAGKFQIDTDGNVLIAGDLKVAGKTETTQLTTEKLIITNPTINNEQLAINNSEITTSASAGTATLPADTNTLTIVNPQVKQNSFIYLTPTSSTQELVLYIKEKADGFFRVGFNEALDTDVNFNWWVVDIVDQ